MSRRFWKQFLLSSHAFESHLLFPFLIALLCFDLYNGRGKPDYPLALAFCIVGYPVVLFLSWSIDCSHERPARQYAIDYHSAPEKLRRHACHFGASGSTKKPTASRSNPGRSREREPG